MVAVKPTKEGNEINLVQSLYGKKNYESWIKTQTEKGNLINNNKEQSLRPKSPPIGQGIEITPNNIIPQSEKNITPDKNRNKQGPKTFFQSAYHGTPHRFDEFTSEVRRI